MATLKLTIPMKSDLYGELVETAKNDQRKMADAGRVLLREALENRKQRGMNAATSPTPGSVTDGAGTVIVGGKVATDRHPDPAGPAGDTRLGATGIAAAQ